MAGTQCCLKQAEIGNFEADLKHLSRGTRLKEGRENKILSSKQNWKTKKEENTKSVI